MRFLILCFILSLLIVPVMIKRLTGGFRVEKLQLDFPFNPDWEAEGGVKAEIREILSQPFYYLDRGSQSYVFVSKDDQYVIKLFRFDHQKILFRSILRSLFPEKKEKADFDTKVIRLLKACKLAYDRVPSETGLVYIHLNATSAELPILHCQDALGRSYRLPLDQFRFVLQKKAEPFREVLIKNIQNKEEMKKCLDSILDLLLARTAKMLHNSDSNLNRNFGFLNGLAIEIDFGNYCNCSDLYRPQQRIMEMKRFCSPLRAWINEQAPQWVPYLDERMKILERMLDPRGEHLSGKNLQRDAEVIRSIR